MQLERCSEFGGFHQNSNPDSERLRVEVREGEAPMTKVGSMSSGTCTCEARVECVRGQDAAQHNKTETNLGSFSFFSPFRCKSFYMENVYIEGGNKPTLHPPTLHHTH